MDQAGGCCQGSAGEVLIRKDEPAVKRSSRMSSRLSLSLSSALSTPFFLHLKQKPVSSRRFDDKPCTGVDMMQEV